MSKHDQTFRPLSLAQHFEAPDDFVGCFGWLCGFSADVGFLGDAVERFTRRTHAQRAYEGRIAMALMLDPGNPQIPPKEVPGILHLPIAGPQPFRLLHAKVAILGFCHTTDTQQWTLRLIVSTGNWTRQTLEESLDLAWRIDLSNQDLTARDDSVLQACADMTAAWGMLDWLRGFFDTRLVYATTPNRPESDATTATRRIETWLKELSNRGRRVSPRFFDNRGASLLAQLPARVREQSTLSARNYLAMGSGFYETSDTRDKIPSVLTRIVERLYEAQLLTRQPEIDVFVNPKACQAVATSVRAFDQAGWKVRDIGKPACFNATPRTLHAKFLFSASHRDNSDWCNSAWVYLGSGNLTGPGFANPMASQSGNLEAGVVFAPDSLRWYPAKNEPPEQVLTNLLPLQWDEDFSQIPEVLAAGSDMPDPEVQYTAAPVAYFFWTTDATSGWLQTFQDEDSSFDVLDEAGQPCPRDHSRGFPWRGTRPRQVRVRWRSDEQEHHAWVAVIDEFGRIAATTLPRIDIEEAWGQLANFPMPPSNEELLPEGDGELPDGVLQQGMGGNASASYPVRQMMQLLENIAAKQTSIGQPDWTAWCTRLEQCLIQAAGSKALEEFVKLKLNPLSPLWHAPFRPDFALSGATSDGLRYGEALARVEAVWNVAMLSSIGDRA